MKKAIYLLILLCAVLFTSCENFLNGSDVLEQLDDMIEEANAQTFTIIVSSDNPEGSFLSSGDKMCKLGYTIEVQFTVKRDVYIYKGLKAVNKSNTEESLSDYVEFEEIDKDDQRGVYKTAIKLIKESNDILILPDCELVPNVVKEDCKPENKENGVEQDSTIAIAFNKPVTMSEFFTPVITDSAGQSLVDYFDEYYMSADYTTLYIPTNKTKNILDPNGSVNQKDVIVKVDLSDITDENGNKGNGVYQHKYRINKTRDTIKPVLTAANLFSTDDSESPYYKELTDKALEDWTSEGDNNGDYGAHHIGGSVYVELEGHDDESGIAGIVVKEKFIKYTDGSAADTQVLTERLVCEKNEETEKYCASYEIKTKYDGIVELEFFVQDYADNLSELSKKYYVIKDTMVDSGVIKFSQELGQFPETPAGWKANIPVVEGDTQTVTLTLTANAKDSYYGSFSTPFDITAYWGYSENAITEEVTQTTDGKFTFTRDVDRFVFIKLICKDDFGNEKEIIKRMAPRAEVDYPDDGTPYQFSIANLRALFVQCNILAISSSDVDPAKYSVRMYRFYDQADSTKYSEVYSNNEYQIPNVAIEIYAMENSIPGAYRLINETAEPLCPVRIYISTTCGDFPSPVSKNYLSTEITSWGALAPNQVEYTRPEVSSSSEDGAETVEGLGPAGKPYLKPTVKITTTPLKSAGVTKVVIDDYMTEAGKNAGIVYTFYAAGYYTKNEGERHTFNYDFQVSSKSKTPELLLNSPYQYKLFIEAYDPATKTIYTPYVFNRWMATIDPNNPEYVNYDSWCFIDDEPESYSFYVNSSSMATSHLVLTEDVTPPYISIDANPFSYAGYYRIGAPQDDSAFLSSTGVPAMYKNERGNYEFDYYIIPNPSNNIKYIPSYTIDELETCYSEYKKVAEFKYDDDQGWNQKKLNIPYGDIKEGFYTISFITKDTYGNTSVQTYPFVNTVLGKLPVTCKYNSLWEEDEYGYGQDHSYYSFTIDNSKNPEIQIKEINGETTSTITAVLVRPYEGNNNTWEWEENQNSFENLFVNTSYENGVVNQEWSLIHKRDIVGQYSGADNPWRKLKAYYGFADSDSALGKGFYNTEYFFIGADSHCNMKNCMDGLNGVQIFSDNTVLVHTLYSPAKLTETRYQEDAATIWETKGAETGLIIYPSIIDPDNYDPNDYYTKNYDLTKLNEIPVGNWYTTIVHFADGTVAMTDIKQKY